MDRTLAMIVSTAGNKPTALTPYNDKVLENQRPWIDYVTKQTFDNRVVKASPSLLSPTNEIQLQSSDEPKRNV
ncbi:hypothetical protein DERP_004884 [Dermatophagoides pteronyssinus]|uniref:Uncharacterized protein n=1 Tax=Dermatophagoides pteronyssinus TaxID=6956 RepID=A0ABQ8JSS5_DERPT|nr:hypothetical protein DERP_004884 [Dermatophagoides pteronyssinus]